MIKSTLKAIYTQNGKWEWKDKKVIERIIKDCLSVFKTHKSQQHIKISKLFHILSDYYIIIDVIFGNTLVKPFVPPKTLIFNHSRKHCILNEMPFCQKRDYKRVSDCRLSMKIEKQQCKTVFCFELMSNFLGICEEWPVDMSFPLKKEESHLLNIHGCRASINELKHNFRYFYLFLWYCEVKRWK